MTYVPIPIPICDIMWGSWYRGHEIARRGGIFYTGLGAGTLTAVLTQAGSSSSLEGVLGWHRRLALDVHNITIPIGIIGLFVISGTVDQSNKFCVNEKDVGTARERLEKHGHVLHEKMKFGLITQTLLSFRFWLFIMTNVFFWNAGIHKNTGSYLLWIKSLGVVHTLIVYFASDMFLGPAWAITICSAVNAMGLSFLTIWTAHKGGLSLEFANMYWSNALSAVIHSWVNNLPQDSPEERMEAPRHREGFSFCLGCAIALIVFTWVMHYYLKRDKRRGTGSADEETINHHSSGVMTPVGDDGKKEDGRIVEKGIAGQGERISMPTATEL
ncbi:major facilitator superfamily transporter [Colletotrichum somersetense]|nr:major facilitator superfamily transporter [Colletotrichum somersetense]